MYKYPRVLIEFCTKCKWNLRAAWYLQELLSTFGSDLGEVAMSPGDSGVFRITIQSSPDSQDALLWDRKTNGGFPDSKELKQLVRDVIAPDRNLGHVDRHNSKNDTVSHQQQEQQQPEQECKDCVKE